MRSLRDGLIFHVQSIKAGLSPPILTSNQLIHLYSKHGRIHEARKLFDEMPERNVFSWNTVISAYIKFQNLTQARAFFDAAPGKDLVTYNSMLSGYVSTDGYETPALELFYDMQTACEDKIKIDEFTVTTILNLSAKLGKLSYGAQLHCFMVKTRNDKTGFAVSSLIDMYSKCGCFKEAFQVYKGGGGLVDLVSKNAMVAAFCRENEMEMALELFWKDPELNDAVSWNTLISGYQQHGYLEESLKLFVMMRENGFRWNEHTFTTVLSACATLKNLKAGKEVHGWVLKNGLISNPFVSSGIVDLYCKCGKMKYAELMHLCSGRNNSFSVTSMIVGYSSQGNMVEARRLFDSLAEKNSVVWTALFSGYLKSRNCDAVFQLLSEYWDKEATVPDGLILMSVLGACAIQAALDPGKQTHGFMLRVGIEMDEKLFSAMIDMYSKCGNIAYAEKMFRMVKVKDSVIYNVMMAGYAHHGHESKVFLLFEEMLHQGIKPDVVTFVALLSACRHCGLVELGEQYFNSMKEVYKILPENDHNACMIDLYGRANRLDKAVAFMKAIPIEHDAAIMGAFLNACRVNKNVELAREAEEILLRIEGDNGARYVQLANIYAAEGNWAEMRRIRKEMRGKVKKFAGCSWVFVENGVNTFISSDRSHSKAETIYATLDCLSKELQEPVEAFL
ncbi:putative pentatricopeptide repeat-containing protein At3g18840 [Gossypium arboreum]|uniref:putative pentatricopeptide repeat-containing protein At3g18840 n=1 Tax=Gossypium arboreum TaxID=29729 RepID=UPI00081948A0|nr:putative pentatricopeptide repeat-containing protein At3g18840 [Gossypium arboreum]XP_017615308.1 putative pentatricopeptide repeat-containing protein At3g18840 [Gossypium arboreum]XP_052882521.1 putative pentatricopeptide repeat-containing protein At3g18840 [Gossypium arboreum]